MTTCKLWVGPADSGSIWQICIWNLTSSIFNIHTGCIIVCHIDTIHGIEMRP